MPIVTNNNYKIIFRILLALLIVVQSYKVWADNSIDNAPEQSKFVAATLSKRGKVNYPLIELGQHNSGSVLLKFMVSKQGRTFEPVVINSTHKKFERSAISALKNYEFIPAMVGEQNVESIQSVRILFIVDNQNNEINEQFSEYYRVAASELKKTKPNKDKLLNQIMLMENSINMSHYNYRDLNIIKQNYAQIFSSKQLQIDTIEQLLLFDNQTQNETILNLKVSVSMRRKLVLLLIQTKQYGSAVIEFEELRKLDPQANELFAVAFNQIDEIYNNDHVIRTPITLSENGYTTINLFKSNFGFYNSSNNLSNIKLRCDKKFASLGYQQDLEYKIPKSWGRCNLQVIGTPNTTSTLYQF